jgi:general secretion pathway protein K
VALAIFAILSGFAYRSLGVMLEGRERLQAESRKWRDVAMFVGRVERDLKAVVDRQATSAAGTPQAPVSSSVTMSAAQVNGLAITRLGSALQENVLAAPQRIAYVIRENRIERLAWASVDAAPREEPTLIPVLRNVRALEFRFLSKNDWRTTWGLPGSSERIPAAVEMAFHARNGRADRARRGLAAMKKQQGVAVLTAILIVAVAASAATLMLAQQSAMVDQAILLASRAQADHYADAGLDWARGVLAEDAQRAGGVDHLGEGWAQPIAALPMDRAIVAGAIEDAQGKFNLNNLAGESKSDADYRIFQRLLKQLALPVELADAVMDWIDTDQDLNGPGGAEDAYYLSLKRPYRAANQPLAHVDELYRIRGFDAATVARLKPHVTALPGRKRTTVNINTATEPVLAAIFDGKVPEDELSARIALRRTKPFTSANDIAQWAPRADARVSTTDLAVKSDYFVVRVQVEQDEVTVASEALVARAQGGATTVAWRRPLF